MDGPRAEPFPWRRAMSVGFGVLQLSPDQFWSMSVRELEAAIAGLFGDEATYSPLERADMSSLMQRFPD